MCMWCVFGACGVGRVCGSCVVGVCVVCVVGACVILFIFLMQIKLKIEIKRLLYTHKETFET